MSSFWSLNFWEIIIRNFRFCCYYHWNLRIVGVVRRPSWNASHLIDHVGMAVRAAVLDPSLGQHRARLRQGLASQLARGSSSGNQGQPRRGCSQASTRQRQLEGTVQPGRQGQCCGLPQLLQATTWGAAQRRPSTRMRTTAAGRHRGLAQ